MKNILVPVDFSECADNALRQAVYIAQKTGGEIHLYHAAPLHPYWRELSDTDRETYNTNLNIALKIEEKLTAKKEEISHQGVEVTTTYTHGSLIENVVEYTRKFKIDLVVIGTHGMSGFKEWMIGSNTQKILRKISCPVLVIKHDLVYRDFNQISFVSDFSQKCEPAFMIMLDFATIFQSEIILVNIDEPGFFGDPLLVIRKAMREFQDLAKSRGFSCKVKRLARGNFEENLQEHIREYSVDLVVVPTHGKNVLARVFTSSIAEAIVNHMDKPVMTILIE